MFKSFSYLLLAATVVLVASCAENKAENTANQEEVVMVRLAQVRAEQYTPAIIAGGTVTSDKEARLSFKTGGVIAQMLVNEGDQVRKGQLLATLNLTEINAQVAQAQTMYDKAKRDFDRVNRLYQDSAITLEKWQNARTGLDIAAHTLDIAKYNQQYSSVYATQSGKVLKKLMNEGEIAGPAMPLYIINSSDNNDWVIRIGIADRDWARIKMGDKANVTLDAYPGKQFTATVSEIAEAADPYSGTFSVELKIAPNGLKLANGLVAKAELRPTTTEKVYLVPTDAVIEANGKQATVFVVTPQQTAEAVQVEIAYILADAVALRSDLNGATAVVTDGAAYLKQGAKIKVVQ